LYSVQAARERLYNIHGPKVVVKVVVRRIGRFYRLFRALPAG
jgi:hypothetical protein